MTQTGGYEVFQEVGLSLVRMSWFRRELVYTDVILFAGLSHHDGADRLHSIFHGAASGFYGDPLPPVNSFCVEIYNGACRMLFETEGASRELGSLEVENHADAVRKVQVWAGTEVEIKRIEPH
ncbi:hypothetical protein CCR75_005651 [Bremia lactucae]|uniref:Uncharacterized protein n=1 Tax=Bremia lactucae TaxID=4779 RepID=A0A976FNM3_BRELC|nr:hypothetical protein CCR75_005651 [Bremia lactucae]